jgi:hypothetical protein
MAIAPFFGDRDLVTTEDSQRTIAGIARSGKYPFVSLVHRLVRGQPGARPIPKGATKPRGVIGCHKIKTKAGRANMSSASGRVFMIMLAAAGCIAVAPTAALAQVKPAVTTLGPDFPKSEIFIGNSFFYYNNGMPGHVSLLEKAADPDHKQDYRATMVTIGGSGFDWHDRKLCPTPSAASL